MDTRDDHVNTATSDDVSLLTERPSLDVRFPCDTCGAQLKWDPVHDALRCSHCETVVPVPASEATIVEHPIEAAGEAAHGLGLERRVIRCDTCGATVNMDQRTTAGRCVYCGSSQVLARDEHRNPIRPESIVPLDVSRPHARKVFRAWVSSLWFRPNALKNARGVSEIGLYVPFWTYDCEVDSAWTADAGYYYYVTETYWTTVNGKRVRRTRQKRKVRWVRKSGARHDVYDDVIVNASHGLPGDLVDKLGPFDLTELVPYRSAYLAGWRAEEYQVDLATGWSMAEVSIERTQRARCSNDVPGDTQRRLKVRNHIDDVHWKHVLLPIWVIQYNYGRKNYTALIHGQTGKVVGKAPFSVAKVGLLVLGIIVAAIVAAFVLAGAGVLG
ncbi:MAG: hypothetical protein AAF432_15885 [Planctomycetota bacterium]